MNIGNRRIVEVLRQQVKFLGTLRSTFAPAGQKSIDEQVARLEREVRLLEIPVLGTPVLPYKEPQIK